MNIGDSEKRLIALQEGSIDVAVTVADVTYLAFHGRLPGQSGHLDNIRGIALVRPSVVHLLIRTGGGRKPRISRHARSPRRSSRE